MAKCLCEPADFNQEEKKRSRQRRASENLLKIYIFIQTLRPIWVVLLRVVATSVVMVVTAGGGRQQDDGDRTTVSVQWCNGDGSSTNGD